MDNNRLSSTNPQLDFSGKIHTYWIKATCDSRFCALDALNRKRTRGSSQTDCQDTAPLIGTRLPRTKDLCFSILFSYLEQSTRTPMKTRIDSSKYSEAICVRDAITCNFLGQSFRTRSALSKTRQWTIQNAVMDSPFCSWTVRSAENRIFGEKFSSPIDDFGGSKMRGYWGRAFVGVPIFALGVCVSTFYWRFLLWAVNNQSPE